jgi:AIG2-like family
MSAFLSLALAVSLLVQPCLSLSTYHYFAFGSNMVPETMTNLRDISPISSTAGVLRDYKLRFSVAGIPWVEPSAAAVERCAAASVHGVLYELTEHDFARVGSTEGVPFGYRWQACEVYPYVGDGTNAGEASLQTGASVSAYTLVAGSPTKSDIPPSKSYRDLLVEGAKLWKLDMAYVVQLENTATAKNLLIPEGLAKITLQVAAFRKQLNPNA